MKEKKYPNPKFSSPEQEDEYWKTHSPLDEGYKGEIQRTKQKRASFLSIRFTGEELTQLRYIAAKAGMGPSTYARQVLRLEIERNLGRSVLSLPSEEVALDELGHERFLEQVREARAAYLETVEHAVREFRTSAETNTEKDIYIAKRAPMRQKADLYREAGEKEKGSTYKGIGKRQDSE